MGIIQPILLVLLAGLIHCQPNRGQFLEDQTLFRPRRIENVFRPDDPRNPIYEVERQNGNGRVEYLHAKIKLRHLDTGTVPNAATRAYARRLGRGNEDAGHIVAKRLGGSGTVEYNIFPQNSNINRGEWARAEGIIYDALKAARNPALTAEYKVRFVYPTTGTINRPTSFRYLVMLPGGQRIVNDFVNP